MKKWILLFISSVLLVNTFHVQAEECVYLHSDNANQVKSIPEVTGSHLQSGTKNYEDYVRNIVTFSDGDLVIFEQKNCLIYNLTVTIYTDEMNAQKLNRIVQMLNTTEVVKNELMGVDIKTAILKTMQEKQLNFDTEAPFNLVLIDKITAKTNSSESYAEFAPVNADLFLYGSVFTLYINIGMTE